MKKVTLIVVLLSMMTISAKAQWFNFSNNKRASIGLNLGCVGYDFSGSGINKQYAGFGIGANLSFAGLYLDFIYQNPEHRWDRKITFNEYPDHTALTINVGYQIPVLSWLYLTPVIGYSNETWGRTIGNSIGVDSENHRVYHDYVRDGINNHFNYGAGLMLRPFQLIEIGAVATTHAIYGNISYSFSPDK